MDWYNIYTYWFLGAGFLFLSAIMLSPVIDFFQALENNTIIVNYVVYLFIFITGIGMGLGFVLRAISDTIKLNRSKKNKTNQQPKGE